MCKILIVDDCITTLGLVTKILDGVDLDVIAVNDGMEALYLAKAEQFDLVMTDVSMPDMDGIQLTAELRNLAGYEATPILMLTSHSSHAEKEKGRQAGASGWLTKPFDPDGLRDAIVSSLASL